MHAVAQSPARRRPHHGIQRVAERTAAPVQLDRNRSVVQASINAAQTITEKALPLPDDEIYRTATCARLYGSCRIESPCRRP